MVSLLSSLAINLLHHHIMLKIKFNGVDPLALVPNLPFTSYILQKFLVFHEYVGLLVNSSKLLIVVLVITVHLCLLGSPDKANDLYGGQEVESLYYSDSVALLLHQNSSLQLLFNIGCIGIAVLLLVN